MDIISLGNIFNDDDFEEIGTAIMAEKAMQLDFEHEKISLPEVAALFNIELAYDTTQKAKGLRGEKGGKRYIFLDPKKDPPGNRRQFFLLLATFVLEDEQKQDSN